MRLSVILLAVFAAVGNKGGCRFNLIYDSSHFLLKMVFFCIVVVDSNFLYLVVLQMLLLVIDAKVLFCYSAWTSDRLLTMGINKVNFLYLTGAQAPS